MGKVLVLVIAFFSISCQSREVEQKTTAINIEPKEEMKEEFNPNQDTIDCTYSQNIDAYIDEIIRTPKNFINNSIDDNCVLSLIDTLNTRSMREKDGRYFKAISAICNVSDGYVSEHMSTIAVKQYYYNLKGLLSFIEGNSCFREVVVLGLSMEVSVGGNKIMEKIQSHAKSVELTKEEITAVENLILEINPKIFD